jgi:hypothetical protein
VVGGSTLGNIGGSCVSLSSQTEFPTGLLGSTFFLTLFNSWETFRISLTSGIFFWTFLLHAVNWVGNNGKGSGHFLVHRLTQTIVGSSTLGKSNGIVVSLLGKA